MFAEEIQITHACVMTFLGNPLGLSEAGILVVTICLKSSPEAPHCYGLRAERSSRPEADLRMPHALAWGAEERRPTATRGQAAAATVRTRRGPRRRFPPEVLSDEEVRDLLDARLDTYTGMRSRAGSSGPGAGHRARALGSRMSG